MFGSKFITIICAVFVYVFLSAFHFPLAHAQTPENQKTLEAKIVKVIEEKEIDFNGQKQLYQKLELQTLDTNKTFQVENGTVPLANPIRYKVGDTVQVMSDKDPEGNDVYYITDFIRRTPLYVLAIIFVLLTVIIGRGRGFKALLGLVFSFAVIILYVLPRILSGADPTFIAISASVVILPVTFYLAHGVNKKTTVALAATIITLIVTSILAQVFVSSAKLSGFASEEAGFLQAAKQGAINIKGLLLAGIIIGSLGILNDITVSQAAIVEKLAETARLSFGELYSKAMSVGHDHIASMVNTLVLVYAGTALPLLLLFINNPHPITEILNYELISEEVVRTLIGSIGLVLAVPITTILASWIFQGDTETTPHRK